MGLGWARRLCAVAMPSGEGAFVLPKVLAQSGCNEMGALHLGDGCSYYLSTEMSGENILQSDITFHITFWLTCLYTALYCTRV